MGLPRRVIAVLVALCTLLAGGVVARSVTNHRSGRTSEEADAREGEHGREHEGEREGEGEGEENEAEAVRERSDWFYGQRAYPNAHTPPSALAKARREASGLVSRNDAATLAFSAIGPHPISPISVGTTYTGTAPVSGRITSFAPDPSNSNVAYLGSATGGVWKTTDGGTNWTPVFDSADTISIGAVAVDPANTQIVYAGTGEGDEYDSYLTSGMYRSTDGGATWSKIGGSTFANCNFYDIAIRPGVSNTLFAAATNGGRDHGVGMTNVCSGARSGVYKSTDSGATWSQVISSKSVTDLSVDQTTTTNVWAAAWGDGIYKSTDTGATWTKASTFTTYGRAAVAVAPTNSNQIYAIATGSNDNLGNGGGIYASSNGGSTWTKQPDATNLCEYTNTTNSGQCWYDLTLAVSPTDATTFYAAGIYPYKFTSSGASNTRIGVNGDGSAKIHVDFHALAFSGNTNRLWIGNDGGAYRTDDSGSTFTNLNNDLEISQFVGISGRGGPSGKILGGTQDNGSILYSGAAAWRLARGGDGGYSATDATNANVMYSSYQWLDVERTADGGSSWSYLGSVCNGSCLFYSPLVAHPANANVVYAGTRYVRRSTNGGTTWSNLGAAFSRYVSAIGIGSANNDTVYAGLDQGGISLTTNGGTTWTAGTGLPARYVTDIAVNPSNASDAWASVSGFGTGHLFHTTNGTAWTDVSGNLPNAPINSLAVNWATGVLYAGTDVGVLRSTNGGTTWTDPTTGMPHVIVNDLLLDPAANTLTAATYGRGAFQASLVDPAPANDNFAAAQVLTGAKDTVTGTTVNATKQAGEPTPGLGGGHSVWYSYTPARSGILSVDTCGSSFDTLLGVYTGSAVNALTPVATNDDGFPQCSSGIYQSRVTDRPVTAGTTYFIEVDGYNGDSGAVTLSWNLRPANDDFGAAQALTGLTGTANGDNTNASTETGEPTSIAGYGGGASIWYSYTAPASGPLTVDVCGTQFDTLLAAYTGSAVNGLTSVAQADEGCNDAFNASSMTFNATAGTTYRIQVTGWDQWGTTPLQGPVTVHWSMPTTVSIGDAVVVEGDGGTVNAVFPVRLSAASQAPVTVQYSTANGSAQTAAPGDYTAKTNQTLTIAAGKTGGNISVLVKGDARTESTETFTVTLSNPTGAVIGGSTGTASILDDDSGTTPTVSVGDVKVVEGNTGSSSATFDVTLSQPASGTVSVPWSTTNGTAGAADFVAASGTLSFPAGTTSKTIAVAVTGDGAVEANETASVNLGAPTGATIGNGSGLLTILDDDASPSATALSIGDVTVAEGDGLTHNAVFTVRRPQATAASVTVHYATAPGSATSPTDFTAKSGTLTIPANTTSAAISIPVIADALAESSESFTVTLSTPSSGSTLGRTVGIGTIVDDDPATSALGIGQGIAVEGNAGTYAVTVPITLSQPQAGPVTVLVNTANVTATAPSDFTALVNKTVTIAAGKTSGVVTVVVAGDATAEGNENFSITLSNPTGATIGRATGIYVIRNDD